MQRVFLSLSLLYFPLVTPRDFHLLTTRKTEVLSYLYLFIYIQKTSLVFLLRRQYPITPSSSLPTEKEKKRIDPLMSGFEQFHAFTTLFFSGKT